VRSREGPVGPVGRPAPVAFFDRPTARVARALLGARLVADRPRRVARIVETEAYVRGDAASHAYRGPTPRNRAMFGPPGRWYVYRIHQVHCVNVVTRPGEAVLLRAAEALEGPLGNLSGPGRLCREFGIDRRLDGRAVGRGPVRLRVGPPAPEPVRTGPRVGISQARELPLRFYLEGVRAVSRPARRGADGVQRSFAQS